MNKRQRKKRNKQKEVTIILHSSAVRRAEDYEKMRESINYQLRAGSVIVLPAYLHVEAILQQSGSRRIEIKEKARRQMTDIENWIHREVPEQEYNEIFKRIEAALGFKLFIWQKTYIMFGSFRQYGETTAQILRALLQTDAAPIDYTRPARNVKEDFYRHQLREIKEKLDDARINTREVFWSYKGIREYKERGGK